MTGSASEGQLVDGSVSRRGLWSPRLWGTAHLTAAVLFTAALICCVARLPGQTWDVQPLPVPPAGWVVWISGIGYLASCAVLHAVVGSTLRKMDADRPHKISLAELITGALGSGIVLVAAGIGIGSGPSSRAYSYGLETVTAVLCVAAALSAALLIAAGWCRQQGERISSGRSSVRIVVPLLHLLLAAAATGGLFWLEQLSPAAAG